VRKYRINPHSVGKTRDKLTIAEAAALAGVDENTIRNRIKAGTYKAERVVTEHGRPTYLIERQSLLNSLTANSRSHGLQELATSQTVEFVQELLRPFVDDISAAREQLITERTRRESAERERDELQQELGQLRDMLREFQEPIKVRPGAEGRLRKISLRRTSRFGDATSKRFRNKYRLLLLGSLAIGTLILLSSMVLVLLPTNTQKIAIPSYFAPGSLWTWMENSLPKESIVIANPSSGPGGTIDQNYAAQVERSRAANLTVLGYVYTNYGRRPQAEVRSDIDKYYSWYGVDGIFLDEASTDCSLATSYYRDLSGYVGDKGGKVILNPGTQTNECYMAAADIIVNFEDTYVNYASDSYTQPGWIKEYPASRFLHLIHAAATTAEMRDAVRLSRERNAGFVYATSDTLPNPWDTLPPYLRDEVMALQAST
jgi:hypothetical protein